MNKLVSRNPVQRFKQGKKIVKAQGGVKTSRRTPGGQIIYDNNFSEPGFFSRFWSYLTSPQQSRVGMNGKPIVDTIQKNPNSIPESKDYSFMKGGIRQRTPDEIQKIQDPKIQKYLQRQQAQGFTAKPSIERKVRTIGISFKQAFNNARNSGLKEFTWNGKRFNTKNKGEENYIFSNGKWINPNIKFTVSSITEPTQEEIDELNRKAKPIDTWKEASLAKNGGTLKSHKSIIQRFRERK